MHYAFCIKKAGADKERELEETKRLFYNLQPKTIICEAQAKKLKIFPRIMENSKRLFKRKRA